MSNNHEKYMKYALNLAQRGQGKVSPNPLVGAVIVRNGEIVAEGYHTAYGKAHAEVEALKAFEESGLSPHDADVMYVTLEPCNHYGKTPPCTEAIIKAGIKNLVVAMTDPNPVVAGKGLKKLEEHGIKVVLGVLEEEAKHLNRVFIKNIVSGKAYCRAKWAMTLDGKMATDQGDSQWISCEASRKLVHKWRAESDAVLIGSGTALSDNPRLNVRLTEGANPYRIVIDSDAKLPINSNLVVCPDPEKTLLVTTERASLSKVNALKATGIEVVQVQSKVGRVDLEAAFDYLSSRKIVSIFSEAGPKLSGALLEAGLIDEVAAFISPKLAGGSLYSPFNAFNNELMENAVQLENLKFEIIDKDILIEAQVRR